MSKNMQIAAMTFHLRAPWVHSLKEKRMIVKSQVVAAVYGGGKNKWRLRGDFTLRKENGVWKLASSQASTY